MSETGGESRPRSPTSLESTLELASALDPSRRVEGRAAVLFVDVTGSTHLYSILGDSRAHDIIAVCLHSVSQLVTEHGGKVVKTMGDGLMSTFTSAEAAVAAAVRMQSAVSADPPAGYPLSIHIGINHGAVLCAADDVFGDTVNVSAYMCALAARDQILVTAATVSDLSSAVSGKVRPAFYAVPKGGGEETIVYQVTWRDDLMDLTVPELQRIAVGSADARAVRLAWGDNEIGLDFQRRSASLGRSEACDIVVEDRAVSRLHATINVRHALCYLSDQSINGTYVELSTGAEVHVLRGELLLDGAGRLRLGRSRADAVQADVIAFRRDRRSMYRP